MTTATWPDRLPNPTIVGYGVQPGETILRTEMEAGPARQRRRFTQVPSRVSVRWVLDGWQFALFEAWYKFHAKDGAEWFSVNLYGGLGSQAQEARFTQQFRATLMTSDGWEVTSELEIRDRPVLSEEALKIALTEDVAGLLVACNSLNVLVNRSLSRNGW